MASEVEHGLRRSGVSTGRILLAVSGGPDSLALLWILAGLRDRRGGEWNPVVGHVDHGLRPESAAEASQVARQAEEAGVPFLSRKIDCRPPGNIAAIARERRLEALVAMALDAGCPVVATAHHADDQLETMLAAIARGSGIDGLRGMPPRRPLSAGIDLVRPMLEVTRSAIDEFVRALRLDPIRDPTNADPRRLRGRLRAAVMPELEAMFPGCAARAAATAEQCGLAGEAIERWLAESFGDATTTCWSRDELRPLSASLRGAGLRRAALRLDPAVTGTLSSRMVREVADAIADGEDRPRRWTWSRGLLVVIDVREVRIERTVAPVHDPDAALGRSRHEDA